MTRAMTPRRVAGAVGLGLVAGLAAVGMVAAAVGGAPLSPSGAPAPPAAPSRAARCLR